MTTLDTEAIRARAQAAAARITKLPNKSFAYKVLCEADYFELTTDVLTLLAELERVTAERDALEYALAEGAEFVRKGGMKSE